MFDTKTPSASEMVEGARMKTRLAELGQRQRERAEGLKGQHLSDDQVEAERFQAEANEYASRNPLYSAARAASTNLLVLPLEPNGARPMVPLSEATNDARQLHKWWSSEFKDSNPGVLLGRTGGILALKVDDLAAYARLRQMATVKHYDEDTDSSVIEYREIGGYTVRHVVPSDPFMSCSVIGWGRAYNRAVNEMRKADEQRQPETFWLVWSFPSIVSGQDAFSYRNRRVGQGLTLMAEGALPWNGSVLDGVQVVAANSRPPEIPTWLGAALGHVRLRREIAAAREAYEAIQRRDTAHVPRLSLRVVPSKSRSASRPIRIGQRPSASCSGSYGSTSLCILLPVAEKFLSIEVCGIVNFLGAYLAEPYAILDRGSLLWA